MFRSFFCFIFFPLFVVGADLPVSIFSTPELMGEAAAKKIAALISEKKNAVLGLATGSTMLPVYAALKKIVKEKDLDLSQVVTFNLDEYMGIPSNHPQSYHTFMFDHLFEDLLASSENPRGIKKENIYIPEGMEDEYETLIAEKGPIDIQLLGIGRNGHIGFAEPGTPFDARTMIVSLTDHTRKDNSRFFDSFDSV